MRIGVSADKYAEGRGARSVHGVNIDEMIGGDNMFFPPIPLIRKHHIIKKLSEHGAFAPDSAVTFSDAGIINPDGFRGITKKLLRSGELVSCLDGRYYIGK